MVYRDTRDPRISQLKQLLASEPELREHRASIRRQHDALQERADQLGRELADAERGGVISTIAGWFGTESPSAGELEEITAKLERLVAEERGVDTALARLEHARAELAELEAASFAALRAMPGPVGDEIRALDAELARETTLIEAIRSVLIAGDRVADVLLAMSEAAAELRSTDFSAQAVVARIRDYVDTLDRVRARHDLWVLDQRVDLPRTQLATIAKANLAAVAQQAGSIEQCTSRLHSNLGAELRERERRSAELAKRLRELVEQAS